MAAADVREVDKAFLRACQAGHVSVVQWLLDHGANLSQLDSHGRSCLMLTCRDGHARVLRELLSMPSAHLLLNLVTKAIGEDSDGSSALHFASNGADELSAALFHGIVTEASMPRLEEAARRGSRGDDAQLSAQDVLREIRGGGDGGGA